MQKRIGEFLVEKGVLTEDQVREILAHSRRSGLRFGEAGAALNLLPEKRLVDIFGVNHRTNFYHLHPRFFPQSTRSIVTLETILSTGSLPLGFTVERKFLRSRRLLNIGMLDPSQQEAQKRFETEARERVGSGGIDGVHVFLVLVNQFASVLAAQYQITPAQVAHRDHCLLDPALRDYFFSTSKSA